MLLTPHTPQHGPGPGAGGADAPAIMALGESFQSSLEEAGRASFTLVYRCGNGGPENSDAFPRPHSPECRTLGSFSSLTSRRMGLGTATKAQMGVSKLGQRDGWMDGLTDSAD